MASEALRQKSPRQNFGGHLNPYMHLREPSPVPPSPVLSRDRSRSTSTKRINSSDTEFSVPTIPPTPLLPPPDSDPSLKEKSEQLTLNIAKVNSLVDKTLIDVTETSCDPAIITIIKSLGDAVKLLATNQNSLINQTYAPVPAPQPWIPVVNSYAAAANKKSRYDTGNSHPVTSSQPLPITLVALPGSRTLRNHQEPRADVRTASGSGPSTRSESVAAKHSDPPEIKLFKDQIREAEKSTLIFNLDMGKVPLLNTETISKRATLALTTMAAKVNKSNTSIPNPDSISAIDDVLSVTKGMSFFGRATKTYNNAKDAASGSFCTVPVKYDFKDHETCIQAEAILRKTCNVNCAAPYPPILRECIRQTTVYFKNKTEAEFVRVSVDVSKLSLRAQYKYSKDDRWTWIE
jgi:hypothetical protein